MPKTSKYPNHLLATWEWAESTGLRGSPNFPLLKNLQKVRRSLEIGGMNAIKPFALAQEYQLLSRIIIVALSGMDVIRYFSSIKEQLIRLNNDGLSLGDIDIIYYNLDLCLRKSKGGKGMFAKLFGFYFQSLFNQLGWSRHGWNTWMNELVLKIYETWLEFLTKSRETITIKLDYYLSYNKTSWLNNWKVGMHAWIQERIWMHSFLLAVGYQGDSLCLGDYILRVAENIINRRREESLPRIRISRDIMEKLHNDLGVVMRHSCLLNSIPEHNFFSIYADNNIKISVDNLELSLDLLPPIHEIKKEGSKDTDSIPPPKKIKMIGPILFKE